MASWFPGRGPGGDRLTAFVLSPLARGPPCSGEHRKHSGGRRNAARKGRTEDGRQEGEPPPSLEKLTEAHRARSVSGVLYPLRGDGHPSRPKVTLGLVRPTRGRRGSRHGPPIRSCSPLELATFHSASRRHRHCGAGPRLTADGCYPLACPVEPRLSSTPCDAATVRLARLAHSIGPSR